MIIITSRPITREANAVTYRKGNDLFRTSFQVPKVRKAEKATNLTSSPYKRFLEEKDNEKGKKKRKEHSKGKQPRKKGKRVE